MLRVWLRSSVSYGENSRGQLCNRTRGGASGPVLRSEFDAPEMRAGRKEFHADASAFFGRVAEIYDAAILLFFGAGVDENQFGADLKLRLEVEKTAVSVDDDGLAIFLEFLAQEIFPGGAHGNASKNARAAALAALGFHVWRHTNIVQREGGGVNGGNQAGVQKHSSQIAC